MPSYTAVENRCKALNAHALELTDRVKNHAAFPRQATLLATLEALQPFATDHFGYFLAGIKADRFEERPKYPPEFVLRRILDRITEDLEALERCFENRQNPASLNLLEKADALALAALEPAKTLKLISKETRVVTYFCKVPSIRIVPYAPVAIVGIPRTVQHAARDFLAIPHEVGHYVYWNPPSPALLRDNIAEKLLTRARDRNSRLWARNWQEEIFADVYGTLVGRAALAQIFQDMSGETSAKQLRQDDGDHPTPVFRPEVHIKILEKVSNGAAGALANNWKTRIDERKSVLPVTKNGDVAYLVVEEQTADEVAIVIDDVRDEVDDILAEIYMLLGSDLTMFNPPALKFPREANGSTSTGEALLLEFETAVNAFVSSPAPDDQPFNAIGWDKWLKAYDTPEKVLEDFHNHRAAGPKISSKIWFPFFVLTGGWTTEGPTGRPTEFP